MNQANTSAGTLRRQGPGGEGVGDCAHFSNSPFDDPASPVASKNNGDADGSESATSSPLHDGTTEPASDTSGRSDRSLRGGYGEAKGEEGRGEDEADEEGEEDGGYRNDPDLKMLERALTTGITVRRHIPRQRAQLIILSSPDQLVSLVYTHANRAETQASVFAAAQAKARVDLASLNNNGSGDGGGDGNGASSTLKSKARKHARELNRRIAKWSLARATKRTTAELVDVQPANEFHNGFYGTPTLRLSADIPNLARSFSLIFGDKNSDVIDLECLKDEEYDVLYHGFAVLLDLINSGEDISPRSALRPNRSSFGGGDGSGDGSEGGKERSSSVVSAVGGLFSPSLRRPSKPKTMAPMPQAEQFLGWKSAGTQIYARLQRAGLIVKKVYSHDRRQLLLKLKLPDAKLEEVAELQRYKVRGRDGRWARFQSEKLAEYQDSSPWGGDVLFRSSERQQMIDWLIRSDIKDGGAGLDERTWLGRQITRRVPLHMSLRLDELHTSWITYWLHPATGGSASHLNAESPRQLLQGEW